MNRIQAEAAATRARMDTATSLAYWNRRYWARIRTSHFSGTFAFDTAAEAMNYISAQYQSERARIRSGEYGSSWGAFDLYATVLMDTQEGTEVQARFILFVDRMDTNYGEVI